MISEILKAFITIFIAEMGDKTQILAMAFATKYPVRKVLAGIFLGVILNHGIAVALGNLFSKLVPTNIVQMIAGCAFIGFALWTLKYEEDDDEEEENSRFSFEPTLTVAAAFFIGELGDKTQLSAITLATDGKYPLGILAGTVSGMMVTGGIGIFVGKKLGEKIPEIAIKIVAASIFMLFGVLKLIEYVPKDLKDVGNITLAVSIIVVIMIFMIKNLFDKKKQGLESAYTKKSRELYEYYHNVGERIDHICLGVEHCGECQGENCIVGHTKALVKSGIMADNTTAIDEFAASMQDKQYDKEKAIESLKLTLALVKDDPTNEVYRDIHKIRRNLEGIVFGTSINQMNDWSEYAITISELDKATADKIMNNK